jgi:hypothetical protein
MARANNMRIPEEEKSKGWMGKNCNPRKADKSTAWEGTAAQQVAYSRRKRINFFAVETALPAQLAWGQFAMLGIVRNPLKLMVSHCKWGGVKPNMCVEHWENRHIFVYIHRYLESTARRNSKKFTEEDLDQAKRRLQRFSLVLVLERLHEAGPLLEAHFGWKETNTATYRSGSHGNGNNTLSHLNQSTFEALKKKSKLDFMLYEYASDLFDQQLELLARPPKMPGRSIEGAK